MCFSLICPSCPSKIRHMTKNIPFFPILHVFAPLNDVRAYIAWSWKTTLITWFFLRGWYPTSNTSGPPRESDVIQETQSNDLLRTARLSMRLDTPLYGNNARGTKYAVYYASVVTHTVFENIKWHRSALCGIEMLQSLPLLLYSLVCTVRVTTAKFIGSCGLMIAKSRFFVFTICRALIAMIEEMMILGREGW